jgi:hypothetical protein
MLDRILGEDGVVNEIIWKRKSSHNDAKQGSKHLGRVHDTLFMYGKGEDYFFKHLYRPYDPEYVEQFYRYTEPETGRRYRLGDLTAPGGAAPSKGNPHYEFLGVTRYWRYSKENMQKLYKEGRVVQTKPGTVPAYKRYLDEGKGVPLGSVWDDIGPVQGAAEERVRADSDVVSRSLSDSREEFSPSQVVPSQKLRHREFLEHAHGPRDVTIPRWTTPRWKMEKCQFGMTSTNRPSRSSSGCTSGGR